MIILSFLQSKSKKDYIDFKEFIAEFTVNSIPQDAEQYIRIIHKNLFNIHFFKYSIKIDDVYLKETISDLLSFAFLSRLGTHKAAMVVLRSSIENFIRYIVNSYLNREELIQSTLVLPLFEESKKYFDSHSIVINHIDKLYSNYSFLCSYSHSALVDFQEQNLVFSDLLVFNTTEIKKSSRECEKTVNSMLTILYYFYYIIDKKNSSIILSDYRSEFVELIPSEILEILTPPL